ncbi:MAG: PA14 domain-containing protein, partial [Thermoguttaceae bacterium]
TAVSGQLNLGTITVSGPGQVTVQLMRQSTAAPGEWTLASQVEFVKTGVDLKVGGPALTSFATTSGITTLAPGAYVVLVSDYAAFNFRYNIAANHIPVAGQYTGHQSNGGELMAVDQLGAADPVTGYIPAYEVDRVKYNNVAPWPTQPAGNGPALIRVHVADYGSDSTNWMASGDLPVTNVGANPGAGNLTLDPLPPTVPAGLAAHTSLNPGQITLTWTASTDNRSDVDHYVIDRNGIPLGTSTTNSYADTTVAAGTNYSYSVSAVNRDGYASTQSTAISAALPGVASYDWLDNQDVEIYFSEPLTSATASVLGNYAMSGGITFSAVVLSRDNTKVTLTTLQALASGNAYTITMTGLATVSGNQLPASLPLSVTYQPPTGKILDQVWDNLDGGDTINDLTNPALNPNYPGNPTYTTYLTSFEAPYNTGVNDYGQRVQGYLYPPTTGNYVFWIASDDYSQLWLSTDSSPNNIGSSPIAYVNGWTAYEAWSTYASQQSASVYLVAGQRYYIEALMKQGTGGDNLSVAWMLLPSGGTSVPDASTSLPNGSTSVPDASSSLPSGSSSVPDASTSLPVQGSSFTITTFTYGGTGGKTATATLSAAQGFVVGQSVLVAGASNQAYNGTFVITSVSGKQFSYTMLTPPGGNAGSGTVKPYGISYSGTTAIVWLPNNGYTSGHWVNVTGASPAACDGVYQITAVTTNTFTYAISSTPTGTATGTITVQLCGITYSGTTATVWLANNGYTSNEWVDIVGASPATYDGVYQITNVTTNTFTYTMSSTPTAPASGTITVQLGGINYSGTTATVLLPNNGYTSGHWVNITGASPATYDGVYQITSVTTNTFTYTMSSTPTAAATGTIAVQLCGITYSGTTATVWLANNGYTSGQWVDIVGASPATYDGVYQITSVTTNTFTYTMSSTPTTPASGTIAVQLGGINYSGTTATVLLPNNGYTSGEWVNITGASPATYDGLYQITGVTTNTFTYTMSSTPTAPSSGTILANIVTLVQTVIPGTYLAPFGGNMDLTAPATPADLCAAVTGSNNQITLTWSPVLDPTSGVDHYAIYRDGVSYATSNAATITDSTGISPQTPHSYQVAAVNYDGLQSALSSAVSISAVGIASISTVSTTSILVAFTEPVDSVSAQVPGNYQIDGGAITVTSAVLQSDNCTVLLT